MGLTPFAETELDALLSGISPPENTRLPSLTELRAGTSKEHTLPSGLKESSRYIVGNLENLSLDFLDRSQTLRYEGHRRKIWLLRKDGRNDKYYFKKEYKESLFESVDWTPAECLLRAWVEAFSGAIYRELLGPERTAKIRLLVDQGETTNTTAIKDLGEFLSVSKLFQEKEKDLTGKLEENLRPFFLIAATSLFMAENDLHGGNWGFIDNLLIRLDYDMSLLPVWAAIFKEFKKLSCTSATTSMELVSALMTQINRYTTSFFKQTPEALSEDIRAMPENLIHSRPYWFFGFLPKDHQVTDKQSKELEWIRQAVAKIIHAAGPERIRYIKYSAFLKILLWPTDNIERAKQAFSLPSDLSKPIGLFAHCASVFLTNRQQAFEDALISMLDFQEFLDREGKTACDEILAEFYAYNSTLKNDRAKRFFGVSEESVKSKFEALCQKARIKASSPTVEDASKTSSRSSTPPTSAQSSGSSLLPGTLDEVNIPPRKNPRL